MNTKNSSPLMNMAKGAMVGLAAGMAVGIMGKKAVDNNPRLKKKADKAVKAFESIVDTAHYMLN